MPDRDLPPKPPRAELHLGPVDHWSGRQIRGWRNGHEFFTFCNPSWRGSYPELYHAQDTFGIIRDIEIARRARFYVCTKTSNFTKICLNLRDMQDYHSLDEW